MSDIIVSPVWGIDGFGGLHKTPYTLIPEDDVIVLLSARTLDEMSVTIAFLRGAGLRFDHALFGLPSGERIVVNDGKPGGLRTAQAINVDRDTGFEGLHIILDGTL